MPGYSPLNNQATTDGYTSAATVSCAGAQRINLDVANAAIYYELGDSEPRSGAVQWHDEVFLAPSFRSLDPVGDEDTVADAIRVRSAAAGVPARVTIQPR